jgi:hypothetical protein
MVDARAVVHGFRLVDMFPGATELTRDRYRTLCRFHDDDRPSLYVTRSDRHGWRAHCFACGWDGNVLDVLRELEGLSFATAAERLGAGDVSKYMPVAQPSRKAYVLVCDVCRDEHIGVDATDMPYGWEIAPDMIAAVGPRCIGSSERRKNGITA